MSNNIIDGKSIAANLKLNLKEKLVQNNLDGKIKLVAIVVGDNAASQVYIRNKEKACAEVGIQSDVLRLPHNISQKDLEDIIDDLNKDNDVHGILVQLPLPEHIDEYTISNKVSHLKDVDGLSDASAVKLFKGQESIMPCTPHGIIKLIQSTGCQIQGKHAVVIGRSNIVGKPVGLLLLKYNATVTFAHSTTANLVDICKQADILVVAIGRKHFVTKEHVKNGAIVIDVGINRTQGKKIYGDVDFDDVSTIAGYITPVPGGVGPMTVACLMDNVWHAYKLQHEAKNQEISNAALGKIFSNANI